MKNSFGFTMAALAAMIFAGPATAGPFFRILDNNGNTINQLWSAYPWPQASFQVDGCSEVLSGTVYLKYCSNPLASLETALVGGRGCGNEYVYPFAEIYSDPAFTSCYSLIVDPGVAFGNGYTYHMTAAPTAPNGLVFKRWSVQYFNQATWSSNSYPNSALPTVPCQEGNTSLSCTVTIPSDATLNIPFPTLVYGSTYPFGGFLPPINPSAVNVVKAGSAVPIQFSLGGDLGISIFAANSPSFQQTSCNTSQPTSLVMDTVTAGGSSLSYDSTTNLYTYVWKTNKSLAGSCGQLILQFNDGSAPYTANFQFF